MSLEGRIVIPQKLEFMLEHEALDRSYCWTNRGAKKHDGRASYLIVLHCKNNEETAAALIVYQNAVKRYGRNYTEWRYLR